MNENELQLKEVGRPKMRAEVRLVEEHAIFVLMQIADPKFPGQVVPVRVEPRYIGLDEGPDTQLVFLVYDAPDPLAYSYSTTIGECRNERGNTPSYMEVLEQVPEQNRPRRARSA